MQIDGGLRKLFRDRLTQGYHWQSVETGGTGLGVPDSNYCTDGVEGWIEYKQTDGWTVDLRKEQVAWLTTRHERGGRVYVAVRRKNQGGPRRGDPVDELWLWSGRHARSLKAEGLRLDEEYLYLGQGGPARWDWKRISEILSAKRI